MPRGSRWPLNALFKGRNAWYTAVLAVALFFVLYPVLLVFIHSFQVGALGQAQSFGTENWSAAFSDPRLRNTLINTVALALTYQAISLVIAIVLAWLIARTDLPGRNWLEFGFWVAFFLPSLPLTLSWILLMDSERGLLNQLLSRMPFISNIKFDIFTWWGIVWVHLATTSISIKVMLLTPAFRNMDGALEEAARTCGAGTWMTFRRVLFPIMAPAILVVMIMGLIHALEAFEVELILGAPNRIEVYSTMIYELMFEQPPQFGAATALGSIVLLSMLPFIVFQQWVSMRGGHATLTGKFKSNPVSLRAWRWPVFGVVLSMVLVMTVLPMVMLLVGTLMQLFGFFDIDDAWTLDNWRRVLGHAEFLRALKNTVTIGLSTAVLAILAFSLVAYICARTKYVGRAGLDFLSWLTGTIPGIVMGLGIIWLFLGTPLLRPIYGTIFVLIIVTVLAQMTTGVQVFKTNMLQIGNELEEAASVFGAGWSYSFRKVLLPLIAPAVSVVGILAFASSVKMTSHVALLATTETRPLSILQLNYMADGSYEAAAVVGVITLLVTLVAAIVARVLGLGNRR
ncbi:MAG: ABC transporter permease [Burkholderiales bacterium]